MKTAPSRRTPGKKLKSSKQRKGHEMTFPYMGTVSMTPMQKRAAARITKIAQKQPARITLQSRPSKGRTFKPFDQVKESTQCAFTPKVAFEDRV